MSEDGDADTWDNIYDDDGQTTLVTDHQLQPEVDLLTENDLQNVNESVNNCQNKVDNKPNQFIFNSTVKKIKFKKPPKKKIAINMNSTLPKANDEDDEEDKLFDDYDELESQFDLKTGRNVRL